MLEFQLFSAFASHKKKKAIFEWRIELYFISASESVWNYLDHGVEKDSYQNPWIYE